MALLELSSPARQVLWVPTSLEVVCREQPIARRQIPESPSRAVRSKEWATWLPRPLAHPGDAQSELHCPAQQDAKMAQIDPDPGRRARMCRSGAASRSV